MTTRTTMRAIALTVMALATPAEASDASYCRSLAEKYETYLNNMTSGRSPQADSVALEQCRKGDASGIPVLEQKLRNAKIDLPPRS